MDYGAIEEMKSIQRKQSRCLTNLFRHASCPHFCLHPCYLYIKGHPTSFLDTRSRVKIHPRRKTRRSNQNRHKFWANSVTRTRLMTVMRSKIRCSLTSTSLQSHRALATRFKKCTLTVGKPHIRSHHILRLRWCLIDNEFFSPSYGLEIGAPPCPSLYPRATPTPSSLAPVGLEGETGPE